MRRDKPFTGEFSVATLTQPSPISSLRLGGEGTRITTRLAPAGDAFVIATELIATCLAEEFMSYPVPVRKFEVERTLRLRRPPLNASGQTAKAARHAARDAARTPPRVNSHVTITRLGAQPQRRVP